ncbi:MAG: hypothetical protein U9Q33_07285 [Campylobacterota bacterium]|nr:hypothetical protein [Campylobacterota bacterium]
MDYDDKIEEIKKLQSQGYKYEKKPSLVINNFFMLITIVMVSTVILIYVNFIKPSQDKEKHEALKAKQHKEYLELRKKQIALSHKLNKIEINGTK